MRILVLGTVVERFQSIRVSVLIDLISFPFQSVLVRSKSIPDPIQLIKGFALQGLS